MRPPLYGAYHHIDVIPDRKPEKGMEKSWEKISSQLPSRGKLFDDEGDEDYSIIVDVVGIDDC